MKISIEVAEGVGEIFQNKFVRQYPGPDGDSKYLGCVLAPSTVANESWRPDRDCPPIGVLQDLLKSSRAIVRRGDRFEVGFQQSCQ